MNENNESANVYFTFFLGEGTFAIDVQSVKEVLPYDSITRIPRTAPYMKGVMNIRGTVISVIDFRTLFDIPPTVDEKSTSIIVTEVASAGDPPLSFGIIADGVEGVGNLEEEKYGDAAADSSVTSQFVKKLGRKNDRFVLILDMVKILRFVEDELAKLE